jgi:hypothetical protein
MKVSPAIVVLVIVCSVSCQTFINANGDRHKQFLPARDGVHLAGTDTSRFAIEQFNQDHFYTPAFNNKKHLVVPLSGEDISELARTGVRCFFYLWNQGCPQTAADVLKLDNLAKQGEKVLVISWRHDIGRTDNVLKKTYFSEQPYYVIGEDYSDYLLKRKIDFYREACPSCYDQYRDDLAVADLLLVENGKVNIIMYYDSSDLNLLRK